MSLVTLPSPSPIYFREHNIDHGHIYKSVSTLCRFSILQETVRGEWERFALDWESLHQI